MPRGEYLLSNAANSVLGRELIQMAQLRGTNLINVVRRREVVAELHKLGCAARPCKAVTSSCMLCPCPGAGMRCRGRCWAAARHWQPCMRDAAHVMLNYRNQLCR